MLFYDHDAHVEVIYEFPTIKMLMRSLMYSPSYDQNAHEEPDVYIFYNKDAHEEPDVYISCNQDVHEEPDTYIVYHQDAGEEPVACIFHNQDAHSGVLCMCRLDDS